AEDGIRDRNVTGVQTCALPICRIQKYLSASKPDGKRDEFTPFLPTVRSSTNRLEYGHDEYFTRTCSCDGESSPHSTEANRDETKAPTFISQDKTEEKSRFLFRLSHGHDV